MHRWKARSAAAYGGIAAVRKNLVTRAGKLKRKEADNAATATDNRRRLQKAATAQGFQLDGYVITEADAAAPRHLRGKEGETVAPPTHACELLVQLHLEFLL